jgi:hypothetical protein
MKTLNPAIIAVLGSALLGTACGSAGQVDTGSVGTTHSAVTIQGQNAAQFNSALLTIGNVSVLADGRSLPVTIVQGRADLVQNQGLALGFDVPNDARTVRIDVGFDAYGGFEAATEQEQAGRAGEIDARSGHLTFELPAAALLQSGNATVGLDLARSLVAARADRILLVPQFGVSY